MFIKLILTNNINFNFDNFCQKYGGQELRGATFSIPNTTADYKDFLASLQAKNARFKNFTTLQFEDQILITFTKFDHYKI